MGEVFLVELFVFVEDVADGGGSVFIEGEVDDVCGGVSLVEVVLEYFEHEGGFADASEAGECDDVGEGEVFGYLCVDVSLCIFKGEGCFPPGVCFYQDIFNLCHVYLTYYRL